MESVGVAQSKLSVEDGVLWHGGFQSSKLPPYLLRSPSLSLRQMLEKLDRRDVSGQQRVEQYPYITWPPIHSLGVILLEIELVDCIDRAVQDYGFLSESTGRPKQRDAIFKLIVSPLETLLKNGFMNLKQDVGGLLHGTVNVGLQAVQSSTLQSPVNANQSQTRMAKAIDHCREEWQVDIVVIPSGFNSDYERVTEALNKARSANIIVFAAAGNHGNVDGVAFPARLYSASMLLCMFATDARANASVRWNPRVEARQGAKGCYAILGENICLQTDANLNSCQGCKTALSGTSYSAAIGAGLAGHLLDFSRQPDCRERIRRRNSLAKVEGMVSVFWSMCEGSDRQVPCMTPWKLLPKLGENDPKPDMWTGKEQARNSICETMSRALEKTY
ncbi:hypothetical protein PoMZ_06984 [Pyricularia oryzae]|uniref:Peptidase S8/S53 domain-containing protein n=1 Tax=Pyricularia oryzae TaxID=318829 RepID=A0A4P7NS62_PYROR|nr:hypothetical protein PoMZ_06984 [Pyricularia oryzae]